MSRVFNKNNYTWAGMKQALTKRIRKELGQSDYKALDYFLKLKNYSNLKSLLDDEKIIIIRKGTL